MHYDVFIIDNFLKFNDFKEYSSKKIRNVNISLFPNFEDMINEIEFVDVLIVHIDSIEYYNIIEKYLKNDPYIIFIINDNSDLAKISNSRKLDILYEPLDFSKLTSKIEYFTNNIKNHILLRNEEDFSNSIINNINNPIFSVDKEHIIFANDHFYELTNCYSLQELNQKYKTVEDILKKKKVVLQIWKKFLLIN